MSKKNKITGIKWICTIPTDWNIIRMKFYSYLKGRIGWQGLTADEFTDEGPYLVTGTDFKNGRVCWECSYHISEKRYNEAPQIQLRTGDLLVTKDGTIGKLAYIDSLPDKASLNSHLLVIRPIGNKFCNRYLYWVLSSSVFQEYYELMSDGSTMDSLSQGKIGNFKFAVPNIDEQEIIADYLHNHCRQIDSIIANIESQIELLQKYKRSLITEAVTKGLDRSAPMKESGVEWIGKIPVRWEIKRLKYCLSVNLQYGANESGDSYTEGYLRYIRITDIDNNSQLKDDGAQYLPPSVAKPYILREGDILFARSGATVGKTFIYQKEYGPAAFAGYLIKAQTNEQCLIPKMLFYFTLSYAYDAWRDQSFSQATIQNIGADKYAQLIVTLPPIPQQHEIVNYLDNECSKFDSLITRKETALNVLKCHKQSLIYEYVTGKKRLKGAASCQ